MIIGLISTSTETTITKTSTMTELNEFIKNDKDNAQIFWIRPTLRVLKYNYPNATLSFLIWLNNLDPLIIESVLIENDIYTL